MSGMENSDRRLRVYSVEKLDVETIFLHR